MINIVQISLVPLGQIFARFALERGTIRIFGAVGERESFDLVDLVCGHGPRQEEWHHV